MKHDMMISRHHASSSASLRPPPRSLRTASSPAFTLIEVIVVIVMLAILAGIVVPRMAGADSRLADAQAAAAGSMLSIVGWRAAVAPEAMELEYDPVSNSLRLLVNRATVNPDNPQPGPRSWRQDPLVTPLVLDRLSIKEAWSGAQRAERSNHRVSPSSSSGWQRGTAGTGSASTSSAWSIAIPVDRPREPIILILTDVQRSKDSTTYRVELLPGRTTARVTSGVGTAPAPSLDSGGTTELDLDAIGLGEQPW